MKPSALKEKIIKKVGEINDPAILNDVINLLDFEDKLIVKLSAVEKALVQEGLDDIDAGRVIAHNDLMKDPRKWAEK